MDTMTQLLEARSRVKTLAIVEHELLLWLALCKEDNP